MTGSPSVNALTRVEVATVWASPDAPRELDAPAVADQPELGAWMSVLTPQLRLGLHGRTVTQVLRGEPVLVVAEQGDWIRVAAPWQPSPDDPRGYPGWVRASHLEQTGVSASAADSADRKPRRGLTGTGNQRGAVLACARRFLNVGYLWGGLSPWGVDCSGLVHYSYRVTGFVVPRDAAAQHAASRPLPSGSEEPGDLYFFADDDERITHVGFVTGEGRMLHASEGRGLVEEATLTPERRRRLIGTGRLVSA